MKPFRRFSGLAIMQMALPPGPKDRRDPSLAQAAGERIAIIGGGPTGTYMLHELSQAAGIGEIVVFESSGVPGPGLPYAAHLNEPHSLANIAGIEIPPLLEPLNDWAARQPRELLRTWGIEGSESDDRAFFPRIVLGYWLAEQFAGIAGQSPHPVTVRASCKVEDVVAMPYGYRVEWSDIAGTIHSDRFDRVVVATGYGATHSDEQSAKQRTGMSFAGAAQDLPEARIGILGSSLSAIDAVLAIAMARGRFEGDADAGDLTYRASSDWSAAMLSRNGLLPEADFWFPTPLPQPSVFTDGRADMLATGQTGDLDALFEVFAQELHGQDPHYAKAIGLAEATANDFAERYFARRKQCGPWAYARRNLADAREWREHQSTPHWRIAILRAHEVFAKVLPRLTDSDLARFQSGLKRVFTDNYAAVPHLSIARLLALHDAGVLNIVALGETYGIAPDEPRRWTVSNARWAGTFDELVDARGQHAATLDHFPFPTLRLQLCANALQTGRRWEEGIATDDRMTVTVGTAVWQRVHLCALPFLLHARPFVQGLVECAQMAEQVAKAIACDIACDGERDLDPAAVFEMLEWPTITLGDGAVIVLEGNARRSGLSHFAEK